MLRLLAVGQLSKAKFQTVVPIDSSLIRHSQQKIIQESTFERPAKMSNEHANDTPMNGEQTTSPERKERPKKEKGMNQW